MGKKGKRKKDTPAQGAQLRGRQGNRSARPGRPGRPVGGRQFLLKYLPLLPLLIAVGLVPLVVFLKVTPLPPEYRQFWVTDSVFDFFSYYKAQLILLSACLLLVAAFVLFLLGRLSWKKSILFIPLGGYAIFLVATTLSSQHPLIALGGFFDRAEGMWVLLAYGILLVGTYLFVTDLHQAWLILVVWAACLCILCILGIFQFFSLDFFSTLAGRLLILPEQYHSIVSKLSFNFPRYYIYGTLYNPNNVASMMSLAFPLAAAGFFFSRSPRRQVVFGILSALFWLALVGSKGQAGWLAVLIALVILVGYSLKKGIPGWWKRPLLLLMVLLLEFSILSFASGGILSRWDILPATDLGPVVETGTGLPATDEAPVVPPSSEALPERLIRKLGSALSGRGYIWIRSLQMAGNTVFLGRGPDTFALYFPNDDPFKSFYGQPDTFIDKPHNMYLQTWLNLGGLAALAFLVMIGLHAYQTIQVLRQSRAVDDRFVLALGLFTGWLAYLVAGFFYDSAVSVAPVFWIIFGLSMAVNRMLLGQTKKM